MKSLSIALTTLVLVVQTHAVIIPLSESRSVSVSGSAGGLEGSQNYSDSQSSSGTFANFSGSVGGSANWNDSNLPSQPFNPFNVPNHAESRASQNSSITANNIYVGGSLYAASRNNGSYQGTSASSSFSSIFEVSFELTSSVESFISLNIWMFGHDQPFPAVDFALTSLNHGSIVDLGQIRNTVFNTMLEPDVYFLRFDVSAFSLTDPLGDMKTANYDLNISLPQVAEAPSVSVPDVGSSAALFAVALVALGVLQKYRRLAPIPAFGKLAGSGR